MNKKWILGVLGPVLVTVLGYWLTDPLRNWWFGNDNPRNYRLDGRVIDGNQNRLLSRVAISLQIRDGETFTDETDSEGRYLFDVPVPAIALLKAAAPGYKEYRRNIPIATNTAIGNQPDIVLTPEPSPPTGPPSIRFPRAILMEKAPAIRYEPRRSETAVKVRVPRAQDGR
jgi:hypothetical protein